MTTETSGISIHELLYEINGGEEESRVTYRIVDNWIRTGAVPLRFPGHGSGTRRMVMADERLAIFALVEHYERIEAERAHLRSGELFLELLGWNADAPIAESA